ncbi:MAG: hypothetical protein FWG55_03625 [Candidatus Bathyarchaeota archaeon]|nr:hypothetical protein [Candidatus Termiticorpusculum sp.]
MHLDNLNEYLTKINWFGVAGGILTLIVILVSLYNPWWQLIVGEGIMKVNASPMNTNFGLLGTQFTVPLIYALNISSILTFSCSGIIMLIYSIAPTKPYAKDLLGFAWKKPLYSVITSVIGLTIIIFIAQIILGMYIPVIGTATVTLPSKFTGDVTIKAIISSAFQWPLYLAVTAAILCITAKIYHNKKLVQTVK